MAAGEPIPISLVAHTVFCPRRAWLEANGEQADSAAIEAGLIAHERVDVPSAGQAAQAVPVADDDLGVVGRCDIVRSLDGGVEIVEHKATPVRRRTVVTQPTRIQLALQRRCLEKAGHTVVGQQVYFVNHRRAVPVELEPEDHARAQEYVALTREIIDGAQAPAPLVADDRCGSCSHVGVCLPDERHLRSGIRRISVADPDGEILYLVTQGSRASLSAGRLRVVKGDETLMTLPFERVRGLVVYGNVDLSSALVRELCWRRLTTVWCSSRGRVVGWTRSAESPNGGARAAQSLLDPRVRMSVAQEIISTKISTQATQLRRNAREDVGVAVDRMRTLAKRAATAPSPAELLGIEGDASAIYFRNFPTLIGPLGGEFVEEWPGRRRRNAGDPLNAALNFVYGLLLSDVVRSIAACGLDPSVGVLHSPSRNKPALALDLMEQFRAPLADSVVVRSINNGELTPRMFDGSHGVARLRDAGRRSLVAAYASRLSDALRHPLFGYTLTWSRTIDVQTRIYLGVVDGSNERFVGVRPR